MLDQPLKSVALPNSREQNPDKQADSYEYQVHKVVEFNEEVLKLSVGCSEGEEFKNLVKSFVYFLKEKYSGSATLPKIVIEHLGDLGYSKEPIDVVLKLYRDILIPVIGCKELQIRESIIRNICLYAIPGNHEIKCFSGHRASEKYLREIEHAFYILNYVHRKVTSLVDKDFNCSALDKIIEKSKKTYIKWKKDKDKCEDEDFKRYYEGVEEKISLRSKLFSVVGFIEETGIKDIENEGQYLAFQSDSHGNFSKIPDCFSEIKRIISQKLNVFYKESSPKYVTNLDLSWQCIEEVRWGEIQEKIDKEIPGVLEKHFEEKKIELYKNFESSYTKGLVEHFTMGSAFKIYYPDGTVTGMIDSNDVSQFFDFLMSEDFNDITSLCTHEAARGNGKVAKKNIHGGKKGELLKYMPSDKISYFKDCVAEILQHANEIIESLCLSEEEETFLKGMYEEILEDSERFNESSSHYEAVDLAVQVREFWVKANICKDEKNRESDDRLAKIRKQPRCISSNAALANGDKVGNRQIVVVRHNGGGTACKVSRSQPGLASHPEPEACTNLQPIQEHWAAHTHYDNLGLEVGADIPEGVYFIAVGEMNRWSSNPSDTLIVEVGPNNNVIESYGLSNDDLRKWFLLLSPDNLALLIEMLKVILDSECSTTEYKDRKEGECSKTAYKQRKDLQSVKVLLSFFILIKACVESEAIADNGVCYPSIKRPLVSVKKFFFDPPEMLSRNLKGRTGWNIFEGSSIFDLMKTYFFPDKVNKSGVVGKLCLAARICVAVLLYLILAALQVVFKLTLGVVQELMDFFRSNLGERYNGGFQDVVLDLLESSVKDIPRDVDDEFFKNISVARNEKARIFVMRELSLAFKRFKSESQDKGFFSGVFFPGLCFVVYSEFLVDYLSRTLRKSNSFFSYVVLTPALPAVFLSILILMMFEKQYTKEYGYSKIISSGLYKLSSVMMGLYFFYNTVGHVVNNDFFLGSENLNDGGLSNYTESYSNSSAVKEVSVDAGCGYQLGISSDQSRKFFTKIECVVGCCSLLLVSVSLTSLYTWRSGEKLGFQHSYYAKTGWTPCFIMSVSLLFSWLICLSKMFFSLHNLTVLRSPRALEHIAGDDEVLKKIICNYGNEDRVFTVVLASVFCSVFSVLISQYNVNQQLKAFSQSKVVMRVVNALSKLAQLFLDVACVPQDFIAFVEAACLIIDFLNKFLPVFCDKRYSGYPMERCTDTWERLGYLAWFALVFCVISLYQKAVDSTDLTFPLKRLEKLLIHTQGEDKNISPFFSTVTYDNDCASTDTAIEAPKTDEPDEEKTGQTVFFSNASGNNHGASEFHGAATVGF